MLLVQPRGQLLRKLAAVWVRVEAMAIGPAAAVDEGGDLGVEGPCADAARAGRGTAVVFRGERKRVAWVRIVAIDPFRAVEAGVVEVEAPGPDAPGAAVCGRPGLDDRATRTALDTVEVMALHALEAVASLQVGEMGDGLGSPHDDLSAGLACFFVLVLCL